MNDQTTPANPTTSSEASGAPAEGPGAGEGGPMKFPSGHSGGIGGAGADAGVGGDTGASLSSAAGAAPEPVTVPVPLPTVNFPTNGRIVHVYSGKGWERRFGDNRDLGNRAGMVVASWGNENCNVLVALDGANDKSLADRDTLASICVYEPMTDEQRAAMRKPGYEGYWAEWPTAPRVFKQVDNSPAIDALEEELENTVRALRICAAHLSAEDRENVGKLIGPCPSWPTKPLTLTDTTEVALEGGPYDGQVRTLRGAMGTHYEERWINPDTREVEIASYKWKLDNDSTIIGATFERCRRLPEPVIEG